MSRAPSREAEMQHEGSDTGSQLLLCSASCKLGSCFAQTLKRGSRAEVSEQGRRASKRPSAMLESDEEEQDVDIGTPDVPTQQQPPAKRQATQSAGDAPRFRRVSPSDLAVKLGAKGYQRLAKS